MNLTRIKNRLLAKAFTALPSLAVRWAKQLEQDAAHIPWAEAKTPLHRARVALITTGGVHHIGDAPFDMQDPDGDPSYREVPLGAAPGELTITHDYYNHADARDDLNLVLPVDRFRTLQQQGAVGAVHPVAYSFMGHIDGSHVDTLRKKTAPEVARRLRNAKVDYALLVPA
ncbi:MAG: glycine/sarcosine/betaine reductase selenoprotein B family protein [Deferrisomatales bacterium]|nr:glycine/sarcosine/betaine reductase selenoprotein B family protein [Deferrisomatales bacterium]